MMSTEKPKKCREEREDEERAIKIRETIATKNAAAKQVSTLKKEQRAAIKLRAGVATAAIQHQISLMASKGETIDYLVGCDRAQSATKFEHERYCIRIARKNFEEQLASNKKDAEGTTVVEDETSASPPPSRSPFSNGSA
jgi:hypothetical protein